MIGREVARGNQICRAEPTQVKPLASQHPSDGPGHGAQKTCCTYVGYGASGKKVQTMRDAECYSIGTVPLLGTGTIGRDGDGLKRGQAEG